MHLSKIKLAGFKSFVDPTTIHLGRRRVAVVGPNGCGKSNTIDAVRWVMGESSAKHLRGESLEDVIFNGSAARKPVGQASVELVFDNSDGALGGQFAQYAEISVKRVVSRDGQSQYFLNGSRCRRRDITDLFLGTGLGPRSYAIIEQGTISRLIEARPEELRVYLEEAAGISKYKERRRETENRIRHTRENLERLNDIREELARRLAHLKRQAQTAERFQSLKAQERRLRAELLSLRLDELEAQIQREQTGLRSAQEALDEALAELHRRENALSAGRERLQARHEALAGVQGRFYEIGAEISRTEQAIAHAESMRRQREQALEQAEGQLKQARRALEEDRERLARLDAEIAGHEPEFEQAAAAETAAQAVLRDAEQAMSAWQAQWDEFNRLAGEPARRAEVERTRMDHLGRQLAQAGERLQRLHQEMAGLDPGRLHEEMEAAQETLRAQRDRLAQAQSALDACQEAIARDRAKERELSARLDERQRALQALAGRLASLEALQESALGKRDERPWLEAQNLASAPRLGECLRVAEGWEKAVEAALGPYLGALCVDDLPTVSSALEHKTAPRHFIGRGSLGGADGQGEWAAQVACEWAVDELLAGFHPVASLEQALARRHALKAGECFVTPRGERVGRHWLSLPDPADARSGVLARGEEIQRLRRDQAGLESEIAKLRAQQADARARWQGQEEQRTRLQQQLNQMHRAVAAEESRLESLRARIEQQARRIEAIEKECEELDARRRKDEEALAVATAQRNRALEDMERLAGERETLTARRAALGEALAAARRDFEARREARHRLALVLERKRSERKLLAQAVARGQAQLAQAERRCTALRQAQTQEEAPAGQLAQTLAALLEQRARIEAELGGARDAVQSLEVELRQADQDRLQREREIETLRERLNERRLALEALRVRRQALREQFDASGFELEALRRDRAPEASAVAWEAQIEALERQLQRLGAINLAAIDEYRAENERAEYLEAQHADLSEALQTLETAIAKIDRETRSRFRATFEQVNGRLGEMFPRLFGGGEARLEMTGDDLLTTGVAVLARPPGKRLSTINLMSGGEKALTAVALVFAIFELNPAPFCMLDEVDAPLDEANVGRFARLVEEMSERVQFIMITHNKISMESAEHLIGVTMREPGVSRLVAVDLDEAERMAMS